MALETGTYISDLVATNPISSDPVGQGDDHLRLLKATILATFPNVGNIMARNISVSAGYTVLSTDNTGLLNVPVATGATITHTVSLPAVASVTAGFFLDLHVPGPTDVVILDPTGATSIEGAATFSFGPQTGGRVFYDGSTWRVHQYPLYAPGTQALLNLTVSGTLSVSGAAQLSGGLTVSGGSILTGGLHVDGATTISGAMVMLSTLHVDGATTISGAAHFKSTVSISGAATLAGTLTVSGAAVMLGTLQVGGTTSFSSTVVMDGLLDLQVGQLKFPAVQNASADTTTLDDYEEGTWTPALTFQTAGDLSVVYGFNTGTYTKIGNVVTVYATLATTTFTYTTASGQMRLDGLPYAASSSHDFPAVISRADGVVWTAASEEISVQILAGETSIRFYEMLPAGGAITTVDAGQMVSGVNKQLRISATYHV